MRRHVRDRPARRSCPLPPRHRAKGALAGRGRLGGRSTGLERDASGSTQVRSAYALSIVGFAETRPAWEAMSGQQGGQARAVRRLRARASCRTFRSRRHRSSSRSGRFGCEECEGKVRPSLNLCSSRDPRYRYGENPRALVRLAFRVTSKGCLTSGHVFGQMT
jgi:hypothetical protein